MQKSATKNSKEVTNTVNNDVKISNVKIKVTFYQSEMLWSFEREVSEDSLNRFTGTALNRFWLYVKVCKNVGAKGFKFSKPINLKIETKNKVYNTGTVSEELQAKLRLSRTTDGMKRFAGRVWSILKFSISEIEDVTFNDFMQTL